MRPFNIPKEEIRLAAKAGFFTKELWTKYYCNHHRSWAFKRWRDFIQREIFIPYGKSSHNSVVRLNRESKIVRSIVGSDICSPPTPYLIRHDSMVINIILGLAKKGKVDKYFFEPEIKQAPEDFGIRWEKKYPDAIVYSGEKCYAIEVELSRKAPRRYDKILNFYAFSKQFDEVHYYSNSPRIYNSLCASVGRTSYPMDEKPIVYTAIVA